MGGTASGDREDSVEYSVGHCHRSGGFRWIRMGSRI